MKKRLTQLCWPVLRFFESDQPAKNYKQSHRVILIIVGVLFLLLSFGSAATAYFSGELGALIPVVVFFSVGSVAVVVGALGSNSAVSKIWGKK